MCCIYIITIASDLSGNIQEILYPPKYRLRFPQNTISPRTDIKYVPEECHTRRSATRYSSHVNRKQQHRQAFNLYSNSEGSNQLAIFCNCKHKKKHLLIIYSLFFNRFRCVCVRVYVCASFCLWVCFGCVFFCFLVLLVLLFLSYFIYSKCKLQLLNNNNNYNTLFR